MMRNSSAFLTEVELAERHKRSVRTIQAERLKGGGIPFLKLGRSVRYRLDDIVAWEEAHCFTSTSDADARGNINHG